MRPDKPDFPLLFSLAEMAQRLRVSKRHAARLASTGRFPKPIRLGRCVRWSALELESWLAAGAPDSATWEAMKGGRV